MSPAGTESAMGGAGTSTAKQQWFLLETALATPRIIGGKQVVHAVIRAGAANPKTEKNRKSVFRKWARQKCLPGINLADLSLLTSQLFVNWLTC